MAATVSALPSLTVIPQFRPRLDPGFLPASLWQQQYRELTKRDPAARRCVLALVRRDGTASLHEERVLSAAHPAAALSRRFTERLLKFLLWQRGGNRVLVAGADELADHLAQTYHPAGERKFDFDFMGRAVSGRPFSIESTTFDALPADNTADQQLGRHLAGCRIGFDLGGSDRKSAAVIDGQVVYAEEVPWDPYFQPDPAYHLAGIRDSLARAAAHLPRVDAIGGSAAGIYVNNEVRIASLFRGVPPDLFDREVRPLFATIARDWSGVPFEVANDGEVTALAGSMALSANGVLGVSMGTSQAGGYVTEAGGLTPWLNELAFAPIDYRANAPLDEWSGDAGCGVQYFSQQGVVRLAKVAGFTFAAGMPAAEILAHVQRELAAGNHEARDVFTSIGVCFGYAVAHYADFYDLQHVLVLGRVTSGEAGTLILDHARQVLRLEFPELAEKIQLRTVDEKEKRHGQAIAAASLPALAPPILRK